MSEPEQNNINSESDQNEEITIPVKKMRKFHAKEFRENLKTFNGLTSIKEFVLFCTEENAEQDYALEFIEDGGTLLDFTRILDTFDKTKAKETFSIFQAFSIVLLKILSKRPDKLSEEICRDFLVKYYPFIKSMLSLSSTPKQRKVALKLLSTLTTISATLAKDVLVYASFEPAVLQILTHPGRNDDQNSVRTAFIHFLLSFLVEGNTALITTFLEKKGLLSSIFTGLLYDKYETIKLILSTIKEKILEDKRLTKTIKMNTFNTQVVKNLVNLYNWKGPMVRKSGNFKKRMSQTTNPVEKNKVSKCVHQFLLILCTSKQGVIFRDPTVGLSGKIHNNLILTVLQGLGKPWDHNLASELVTKICVVCPDLVKPVLSDVAAVLDPRISKKWTNAIQFVKNLIENLTPETIGQYFEKLNIKQVGLVIQTLCVPKNIIQILFGTHLMHEYLGIRHEIINLLFTMCKSVSNYLNYVEKLDIFSNSDKIKLKEIISEYLEQNLPNVSVLIEVWNKSNIIDEIEELEIPFPNLPSHLSLILDILYEYHLISPSIVEDLTNQIDMLSFLQKIQNISNENNNLSNEMYVKAINLFLVCDFASFLPTTDKFEYSIPLLLNLYYKNIEKRKEVEKTLFEVIKNTGIFEGCLYEIKIWLYSFLELDSYNDEITNFFMISLKVTYKNYIKYCKEISKIRENMSDNYVCNYKALIETLRMDIYTQNNETNMNTILSPFVIGVLNTLKKQTSNEIMNYINLILIHLLHAQTTSKILSSLIFEEKYFNLLDKNLTKYYQKWNDCDSLISVKKFYGNKNVVKKISKFLIEETDDKNIDAIFEDIIQFHIILSTRLIIFYLTQLSRTQKLTENFQNKCLHSVEILIKKSENNDTFTEILTIVLKNPLLLQLFSPIHKDDETHKLCTSFILQIIENLTKTRSKLDLEPYLHSYRTVLIRQIYIMLERCRKQDKTPKNTNFINVVQLLELNSDQCIELLKVCANLPSTTLVSTENTISGVVELISYILKRLSELYLIDKNTKLIDVDIMKNIGQHLVYLNEFNVEINFENFEICLFNYIEEFPHLLAAFNVKIYKSILLKPNVSRYSCKLAMQFLKCDEIYIDTTLEVLDNIIDKRELVFSLLFAIMNLENPKIQNFFEKVNAKHEQIILKVINKPQKIAQYLIEYYKIIIKIIQNYKSIETCKEFCLKSHKFDTSHIFHFEIITTLYDRYIKISVNKNKFISNYIITAINYILDILKQEKSDEENQKLDNILKIFCTYLNKLNVIYKINYKDENLLKNPSFQTFSKLSLKFGLQGIPPLIDTLRHLCEFCLENEEYLGLLFEMAISHSEALNIILDNENETKSHFIHLLYILCKKYPSVINKNHIPVWLGAYNGTLSISDQYLLKLMAFYEEKKIGFNDFKPHLWGQVAVSHYSVKFGVETALWRQPKPAEVLDIFDVEKIKFTITNFPKSRKLSPEDGFYSENELNVYDPAFYLPVLSQLLAPESTIKWYQCKFGPIALAIVALSSDIAEVRIAACLILSRFHGHLEAVKYGKDRLLYLHFVEALCKAASKSENLHLSSIAGIFMARCALIFHRPDNSLYTALTNYIMAKEYPDVTNVPELLELLHSADVKFVDHRNFILEVMRDGLKTDYDLKIMFRSMSFKLLMDIYNSVVINHVGKRLILEILTAAVTIPSGARILIVNYGLMSWLLSTIKHFNQNDYDLLSTIINLIKKLYLSLEADQLQYCKFYLLHCLVLIIDCFKFIRVSSEDIVKFVSILNIVYNIEPRLLTKNKLIDLLNVCNKSLDCHVCNYYLEFGSSFIEKPEIVSESSKDEGVYYLKLLTLKWIENNKNL